MPAWAERDRFLGDFSAAKRVVTFTATRSRITAAMRAEIGASEHPAPASARR